MCAGLSPWLSGHQSAAGGAPCTAAKVRGEGRRRKVRAALSPWLSGHQGDAGGVGAAPYAAQGEGVWGRGKAGSMGRFSLRWRSDKQVMLLGAKATRFGGGCMCRKRARQSGQGLCMVRRVVNLVEKPAQTTQIRAACMACC